ncbi:hypothetical protein, partial [Mesorhizobium sp. M4B.F.Ca.ET.049.02.1.2]|uniref:hypothetical protein n=1 Tax=Mesorhizobium sp. M4B.F.Ca.ET.049.02.1.2 TaxID=2496752 RepID=UPI001AECCE46
VSHVDLPGAQFKGSRRSISMGRRPGFRLKPWELISNCQPEPQINLEARTLRRAGLRGFQYPSSRHPGAE